MASWSSKFLSLSTPNLPRLEALQSTTPNALDGVRPKKTVSPPGVLMPLQTSLETVHRTGA